MSNGIIVLGMHRSGTSLIAELIHRWGAFGRVEECLPSNQWNERGYWELAPLVDFNRRLLRQVGANWSCPPNQDRDSDLAALAQRPEFRKEALRLISSMNGEFAGTWFWKDPRLSLLLPFWQELWDNPRYVICLRDPFEICRSLEKRDGLSFSVSMMLWHRYMLSILERTRNRNTLILSYSQMIRTPKQECERLARFLSDQSGHGHPARAAVEMQKAVSAELRHYQADSYMPFTLMTRRQRNLQEVLEILSHSCNLSSLDLQGCSLPQPGGPCYARICSCSDAASAGTACCPAWQFPQTACPKAMRWLLLIHTGSRCWTSIITSAATAVLCWMHC